MPQKDPAFLLYSSDFLTGVADLTMKERGQYVTMLCLQHQKGRLSDKTIKKALGIRSLYGIKDVIVKFEIDDEGLYYNKRLEEEMIKRERASEASRENGALGGRPKKTQEDSLGFEKSSKETKPQKPKKPEKRQFAEFVKMTDSEFESLVERVGEDGAEKCIEILDNYKGANGKKYVSDYRAILNWVIKRYEEEKPKTGSRNMFLDMLNEEKNQNEQRANIVDIYDSENCISGPLSKSGEGRS